MVWDRSVVALSRVILITDNGCPCQSSDQEEEKTVVIWGRRGRTAGRSGSVEVESFGELSLGEVREDKRKPWADDARERVAKYASFASSPKTTSDG